MSNEETGEVHDVRDANEWIRVAARLARAAREFGHVITIEQKPLQPLAMGHTEDVVTVHPLRTPA